MHGTNQNVYNPNKNLGLDVCKYADINRCCGDRKIEANDMDNTGYVLENEGALRTAGTKNSECYDMSALERRMQSYASPLSTYKGEAPVDVTKRQNSKPERKDDDEYDPYDFDNAENPTSVGGTLFHLCIMSAGPSLLSIPQTFLGVGLVGGFLGVVVLVYTYGYNIHVLVTAEYRLCRLLRIPHMSYFETVFHAFDEGPSSVRWFAPYSTVILYAIFLVLWLGYNAFNLALVGLNLKYFWSAVFGTTISIQTSMYYVFIPLLLLCWIRKLAFLVPLSLMANAMNVTAVVVVVYHIIFDETAWKQVASFGDVSQIPLFVGATYFNITATGVIMPLKNEMKEPRKFNAKVGVLSMAYTPMAFVFAFLGLFCCMKYGTSLQDSVVLNLPMDQVVSRITLGLFILATIFQFPLVAYIVFDLVWNSILGEKKERMKFKIFWEYVVRSGVVIATFVLTLAVPTVNVFLTLCGTCLTPIDSMIVPSLVESLVLWRVRGKFSRLKGYLFKNLIICVIAVVLVAFGVQELIDLIVAYYS